MDFVKFEVQDNIGIVTVNRPPVNSLNTQLYNEIRDVFRPINAMDEVKVVILRAEGKQFLAGNDLNELRALTKGTILAYRDLVNGSVGAVYDCRVPVIAAVNGAALGAGLAYSAACDIIVASERAIFGLPEVKIGFISAGEFLGLLVPSKVVNYMALTGTPLKAEEMMKYGAVHKVVPGEQLMDAAMEVAHTLLGNSTLIEQGWKRALHVNSNAHLAEQAHVEWDLTYDIVESDDYEEAMAAFLEHRKPNYTGK